MKISILGMFLYTIGFLSLILQAIVTLIVSLQAGEFVWSTGSWVWLFSNAAAVILGIALALAGFSTEASDIRRSFNRGFNGR